MYETYTYEQVKNLPDDQKVIALKELKAIYPENKILAEHWDVAHIAVSNMVGKYLEGKQMGRKKMTDEEKAQKKLERETEKLKQLQEQQRLQQQESQSQQEQDQQQEIEKQGIENEASNIISYTPIVSNQITETFKPKSNAFGITLNKTMSGEEAIKRFNGIANSLLGKCEYKIEVSIEEV